MEMIRIYLNEQGVDLPAGATVRDALSQGLPDLLPACDAGTANLTDGRGLPVVPDLVLTGGAILRASRSSRRAASSDAGA